MDLDECMQGLFEMVLSLVKDGMIIVCDFTHEQYAVIVATNCWEQVPVFH